MARDTPPSENISTHQIWNSYLKEYRRYAPDTERDGRTDSAITIWLPKFFWGGGGGGHKNNTCTSCVLMALNILQLVASDSVS